jgi:hypothetical protein
MPEVTSEEAPACTGQVGPLSAPRSVFAAITSEVCSDLGCSGYTVLSLDQHFLPIPTPAKSPSVDLNWRPEQSRPGFEWVPYVKPTTTSLRPDERLPCPKRACNPKAPAACGHQISYLNAARRSL